MMDANDSSAHPVHAVYANGVFRATSPVQLPENCEVEFVPKVVEKHQAWSPEPGSVEEILSRRYNSGQHDTAERHNEHQP